MRRYWIGYQQVHEHLLKPKELFPAVPSTGCRTAVELSIAVTKCARLARVRISAQVMGGFKAHSRSRSGGRRGGRGRDTTMVIDVYVLSL